MDGGFRTAAGAVTRETTRFRHHFGQLKNAPQSLKTAENTPESAGAALAMPGAHPNG
jgi:hypothetical protein